MAREQRFPVASIDSPSYLSFESPQVIDRMALGFDALAADVYWIRAIQHYGGERLNAAHEAPTYDLLYPLLNLTTSLDPYFSIAYRFGAIFLSEPYPGGPGRPELGVALLQKGIVAQPTRWEYYNDIGFVHYWSLQDPRGAAEWFRTAAAQPGAPEWLLSVAAAILSETTDRAAARQLWRQILQSDQQWLRERAERGLLQLDALDQIDKLNTVIQAAGTRGGEPFSWQSLIRSGFLRSVPLDPSGTPYDVDSATGRVTVARTSPLFPLPALKSRPQ
jgi:hypothetical protein